MKFIDLFAGIGGFRYGLERCNSNKRKVQTKQSDEKHFSYDRGDNVQKSSFDCVYSNEWDKYASQIYKKHYGECDTRDIRTVKAREIPDHDLLCAGFPCQAFSVAGKRLGFEDTRGTLFFEIARIVKHKRPRYLLLENVKGLLSHEEGKTFQTIIGVLADLGYRVEWQVLNSKHFGVPQNRERVFIVGHLGKESGQKVFPIQKGNEVDNDKKQKFSEQISNTLRTNYSHGYSNETYIGELKEITKNQSQGYRVYDPKGVSTTLAGRAGGVGAKTGLYAISSGQARVSQQDGISTTITAGWGESRNNAGWVEKGMKIRRLTPTECERLQGFPDGWTAGVSDTQRYKCLGNAVTTNVISTIREGFNIKGGRR